MITLTDGSAVTDDHRDIDPATGLQKGYVVLSEAERAKGFIEPVRLSYVHTGRKICGQRLSASGNYEKIGSYTVCTGTPGHEGEHGNVSMDISADKYARFEKTGFLGGCGNVTIMGVSLAETYAREPEFYSGTYCAGCRNHFPIGEQGEFVWKGTFQKVGTRQA